MKSVIRGAVVGLAVALSAQAAQAQVSLGVGGGAVVPTGSMADAHSMGWSLTAVARVKPPVSPLGLQVDGFYNRFGLDGVDGNTRIIGGTANAVFAFPGASAAQPYLVGGVGVYNVKSSISEGPVTGSLTETKFGLNAGAGFDFGIGKAKLFADARFHAILKGTRDEAGDETAAVMIPVTVGLRF